MSKMDLVEFIASKAGLTKADAARALDATLEGLTTGLKKEANEYDKKKARMKRFKEKI